MKAAHQNLIADVRDAVRLAGLVAGDCLTIGLSGGIDSQTLTHLLAALRDAGEGPAIHAVHVDHQLRPSSHDDARAVERYAHSLNVPLQVVQVDVDEWGRDRRQGVEAAARDARYAALGRSASALGTRWIALGHTLDDQAETLLLRLARGTSLDGLTGMRIISARPIQLQPHGEERPSFQLLRPLLHRRRIEIEAYAQSHGLVAVEDETNADPRFLRNAIRHRLLPAFEQIVPGAVPAIARTSDLITEEALFLDQLATTAFSSLAEPLGSCIHLDRTGLCEIAPALQRRVLLKACYHVSDELRLSASRIESLRDAACTGRPGTTVEIGSRISGYVDYEELTIGPADKIEPTLRQRSELPLLDPETVIQISRFTRYRIGQRLDGFDSCRRR